MAKLLGISRSAFYKYLKRKETGLGSEFENLLDVVKNIWEKSRKNYGLPRIKKEIRKQGIIAGQKIIRKAMKMQEIQGKTSKKYKIVTTDSNHKFGYAPNLLDRKFSVNELNKVWTSDVTFIRTSRGWIYLAVILDLCSRRIISWKLSGANDFKLILSALEDAFNTRQVRINDLIFHSDRGSNYCSYKVKDYLHSKKVSQSMSRKGNCWDNAPTESFFATLKREMEFTIFKDLHEAEQYIFDYIEVFYNRQRLNSTLDYQSPVEYEEKLMA